MHHKLLLRVPDDEIGIVARCQAPLPVIKATQLGRVLREESRCVRELEAPPTCRGPEE